MFASQPPTKIYTGGMMGRKVMGQISAASYTHTHTHTHTHHPLLSQNAAILVSDTHQFGQLTDAPNTTKTWEAFSKALESFAAIAGGLLGSVLMGARSRTVEDSGPGAPMDRTLPALGEFPEVRSTLFTQGGRLGCCSRDLPELRIGPEPIAQTQKNTYNSCLDLAADLTCIRYTPTETLVRRMQMRLRNNQVRGRLKQ